MLTQRIPGLALAIVDHGRIVLARGYGSADLELGTPVTPDTLFQSGSLGKQFTAAAVMLLVEDGRLSLDDPVSRFLPEAPREWGDVRIRHLLTHTSGIPDYTELFDMRRSYSEDELVRLACGLALEFAPGARYSYSNTGYLLLGAILHRAGGRPYSEILRERIFAPLGMKSARLIDESAIIPHRAAGYRLLDGRLANQEWVAPELNTTADGSLYLSLNDMIAWDRGLRAGKILSAGSWHEVFTPVRLNSGHSYPYGFGWEVYALNGQTVVAHDGAWQGFTTHISRYLGDDLTVIVLTNLAEADPGRIARKVAAALRDDLAPPPRAPIAGDEPARRASLEQLLRRARDGMLTGADLPHMRGGFRLSVAEDYRHELAGLGDLTRLALIAREARGDDEQFEYLAAFEHGPRIVVYTIDPQGRPAELEINPAD